MLSFRSELCNSAKQHGISLASNKPVYTVIVPILTKHTAMLRATVRDTPLWQKKGLEMFQHGKLLLD